MNLKEQLEIIRGEPIQVFEGEPMDIPCIETSDAEKLCKNPVVSVHMITYNHEPYIRQAIEGVMMQKTDFEFELIIGEDASQDKTREICFEYQKKYPDKIRVLWWHENVSKLGGNSCRVYARCRGEFIAFCEGDDYWTDPLKLQKQVDVMRQHLSVGLCFTSARIKLVDGSYQSWNQKAVYQCGEIKGRQFLVLSTFGKRDYIGVYSESVITATVMVRSSFYTDVTLKYDIFNWVLRLGDTKLWLALTSVSDAFLLPDITAVYRRNNAGVSVTNSKGVHLDGLIVRLYYINTLFPNKKKSLPSAFFKDILMTAWSYIEEGRLQVKTPREYLKSLFVVYGRRFFFSVYLLPIIFCLFINLRSKSVMRIIFFLYSKCWEKFRVVPKWILDEYR